jgi:hypothetical protein
VGELYDEDRETIGLMMTGHHREIPPVSEGKGSTEEARSG